MAPSRAFALLTWKEPLSCCLIVTSLLCNCDLSDSLASRFLFFFVYFSTRDQLSCRRSQLLGCPVASPLAQDAIGSRIGWRVELAARERAAARMARVRPD